jgi:hypothetical protein
MSLVTQFFVNETRNLCQLRGFLIFNRFRVGFRIIQNIHYTSPISVVKFIELRDIHFDSTVQKGIRLPCPYRTVHNRTVA